MSEFRHAFQATAYRRGEILTSDERTYNALVDLGMTMESEADEVGAIPSGYTYFGQMLSHELMLFDAELGSALGSPGKFSPKFHNGRDPTISLESVYGPGSVRDPDYPARMLVGRVAPVGRRVPGKSEFNDLPRAGGQDSTLASAALIADRRNDRNLCLAQLHVVLLRAHNALVSELGCFWLAKERLQEYVLRIVETDYLPRIIQPDILNDVWENGPKFFRPAEYCDMCIPLEFAGAAYRFGHSMVRREYNFNCLFEHSDIQTLLAFTAESGNLLGMRRLMRNWVVDWSRFVKIGGDPLNFARKIGPFVAEPLRSLNGPGGTAFAAEPYRRLAVLDLLWGQKLGLPTGQALAIRTGCEPLEPDEIIRVAAPAQREILRRNNFDLATPLFYYILAEAASKKGGYGQHLGDLGSRIVAETFWNVLRFSAVGRTRVLGDRLEEHTLADLIVLSGNGEDSDG